MLKKVKEFNFHIRYHEREELKCEKCIKVFSNKLSLQIHSRVYRMESSTTYPCEQCNEVLSSEKSL